MENKTTTLKVWVTKNNFALIQEGSYPKEFDTTPPSDLSNYVEMTVNMSTISEWTQKHLSSTKPRKNFLFD